MDFDFQRLNSNALRSIDVECGNVAIGDSGFAEALKPIYKGAITNSPTTVQMAVGFYFVTTYRSGGYKLSSLSLVNIQIQNGSFIETLVKGEDYDTTINMNCTEENISFQYKIKLNGECTINIFKLVGAS